MTNSEKAQKTNAQRSLLIAVLIVVAFVFGVIVVVKDAPLVSYNNEPDSANAFGWWNHRRVTVGRAILKDAQGTVVGVVRLTPAGNRVRVRAAVYKNITNGYHGFHIHTVGKCEAPDFTTAGGHYNPAGTTHNSHAGDMPSLLVDASNVGASEFLTDRFKVDDLFDADGSAIVVHAAPDNFANIPARYSPAPDTATLNTGDAGARVACGVIEKAGWVPSDDTPTPTAQ